MDIQHLRGKFLIMKVWAERFNIHDFPETLDSLTTDNYDDNMIRNDFKKLEEFYSHPAYLAFFGGYEQVQMQQRCFKE